MKNLILTVVVIGGSVALSACSNTPSSTSGTTPPTGTTPPPTASFQSQFGASFLSYFNTDANTDPKVPTAADVPPLSLTTEPIAN